MHRLAITAIFLVVTFGGLRAENRLPMSDGYWVDREYYPQSCKGDGTRMLVQGAVYSYAEEATCTLQGAPVQQRNGTAVTVRCKTFHDLPGRPPRTVKFRVEQIVPGQVKWTFDDGLISVMIACNPPQTVKAALPDVANLGGQAIFEKGFTALQSNELEQAEFLFREGLKRADIDGRLRGLANYYLAESLRLQNKIADAARFYQEAVRLIPGTKEAEDAAGKLK